MAEADGFMGAAGSVVVGAAGAEDAMVSNTRLSWLRRE